MKRHLLILLLTALLGVGAVALCKYWNVLFPTGETSEIYRQYYKTPGIRAAYIQNMTVDDTIHFDITLLEARDSATYVWLLRDLGQDEDQITIQMDYTLDDNPYFVCLYKHNDTDLVCSLPTKHTAAILHPYNPQHKKTIIIRSLHKQIKINQSWN